MVGYAIPNNSIGSHISMPIYAGSPRQMGAGFFGTLKRFAMPILRKLTPHFLKAGKRVAKSALNVGRGVLEDVRNGSFDDIRGNLRKRGRHELGEMSNEYFGEDILPPIEQKGSGRKRSINKKKFYQSRKKNRQKSKSHSKKNIGLI